MSPQMPEMPEGFPVIPAGKYKARLDKIDDRIITGGEGESKWEGKKACWWRFKLQEGDHKGLDVSENTIMPFNADDTPVEDSLKGKCWRWRDLCKTVYGGEFPKIDWEEFKQKVTGTEWVVEIANRMWRGSERSEVVGVMKPEDEAPF